MFNELKLPILVELTVGEPAKVPGSLGDEVTSKLAVVPLAVPPSIQVLPPFILYSQRAPSSKPETLIVGSLVRPSAGLLPVSVAKAIVGGGTCTANRMICKPSSV